MVPSPPIHSFRHILWVIWGFVFSFTTGSCANDSGGDLPINDVLKTQYRGTPQHLGTAPPSAEALGKYLLTWRTEPMAIGYYLASKSSPIVDENQVYVGMDDGRLLALSKETGELRWSFRTHRFITEQNVTGYQHLGIHGTPAVDDHHVYIGDYDGYLYAVQKQSGELIWEQKLGDAIGASPTLMNAQLFIAVEFNTPDGQIFVLDAQTGDIMWESDRLGHHAHSSVSIHQDNDRIFVGNNYGTLFCFAPPHQAPVWKYATFEPIKSTAAVLDDTVYITSWDHYLHAVNIADGEKRFAVATQDATMSSPAVFNNRLYFGSHDGHLYAADQTTGAVEWTYQTDAIILSSPIVIEKSHLIKSHLIVFGSRDRYLYLLRTDGTLFQKIPTIAGVSSVPTADKGSLFISDNDGHVYRFDSTDGDIP